MFNIDITKYVPRFILNDKNGFALAKAIETALQMFNNKVHESVKLMYDVASMPEWRLDEIAWETQCFYDYNADIDLKRSWIKNAVRLYSHHGTKKALKEYISAYFDDVEILEAWEYDSDPYHFLVNVQGEWTKESKAWLDNAIEQYKNARSVSDYAVPGIRSYLGFTTSSSIFEMPVQYVSDDFMTGTWPEEVTNE